VVDLLPAGWGVCQDTSSEAKAGAAVAYSTTAVAIRDWWIVKGCDAPAGGGMLPRWIMCADLEHESGSSFLAISAHSPPPRYAELQPGFTDVLAEIVADYPSSVVGADANQDIDRFARDLGPGQVAYGKQSGICLVSALPITDVALDHYGENQGWTDHPAVTGSLP
jgi:hypothetical protein